jgi:hypothetical protein
MSAPRSGWRRNGQCYNWQAGIYYLHMDRRVIVASKADEGWALNSRPIAPPIRSARTTNSLTTRSTPMPMPPSLRAIGNITDAFNVDVALR